MAVLGVHQKLILYPLFSLIPPWFCILQMLSQEGAILSRQPFEDLSATITHIYYSMVCTQSMANMNKILIMQWCINHISKLTDSGIFYSCSLCSHSLITSVAIKPLMSLFIQCSLLLCMGVCSSNQLKGNCPGTLQLILGWTKTK